MNSPAPSLTVCASCLQPRSVDEDGLCLPCSDSNRSMDGALLALIQPAETAPTYSSARKGAIAALEEAVALIGIADDVEEAQRLLRGLIKSTKANADLDAAGEPNHAGQEQPADH